MAQRDSDMPSGPTDRRSVLAGLAAAASAAWIGCGRGAGPADAVASTSDPGGTPPIAGEGTLRVLGPTGAEVEPLSLGGEGILRTHGQTEEAVAMVLEALSLGVRYIDTAPAYAASQDYIGEALRRAGPGARDRVFLASKTHDRTRDGARRLLEDSLARLGTDHLDLWQMHDLRTTADLDAIFGPGGAIEAATRARDEGLIRFIGLTGHHDPQILVEGMQRFAFDTVLCAFNPADARRRPFLTSVVAEARARHVGVIGMKALAAGRIPADGTAQPEELIRYAATFVDTVIVGCSSPAEVRDNLAGARRFTPMDDAARAELELRLAPQSARYDTFKA